ncbi:MAG: PilZ domain-containing protein [Treponema sp.]|jgi:c-di-GMP-binding flagellar brake protein YcgR|nr:PilZ domain-containing protein [Treponema sp.]
MIVILIIILVFLSVFIFFKLKKDSGDSISWMQFYTKGKEAGFNNENIKLLKELAQQSGIERPAALFWSKVQMDECIKKIIKSMKQTQTEYAVENQEFLAKLYDFRLKMEMDRPIYKNGITSSRNIGELQIMQVVVTGAGVFKSKVVSNKPDFISIERPDSSVLDLNFSWKKKHLLLYFWRKNDAGYCFESDVIDEVFTNDPPLLTLTHSNNLIRTQSRKTLRVKTHCVAMLYRVDDSNNLVKSEVMPGIKCYLEDISDSGCAVTAGGTASAGLRVIVQFVIDKTQLSISGVVRSVDYNEGSNTSLMHIESDLIPMSVKNKIFSVMFGMIDDTSAAATAAVDKVNRPETAQVDNPSTIASTPIASAVKPIRISNYGELNATNSNKNVDNDDDDDDDDVVVDPFDWGAEGADMETDTDTEK